MKNHAFFSQILTAVNGKCSLRVHALNNALVAFEEMRKGGKQLVELLQTERNTDSLALLEHRDLGKYQFQLNIGEDAIIFNVHQDVFEIEQGHPQRKTSYLKEDVQRGFCGMISIYNFLSSSLNMNRSEDMGMLVARVLINSDNHVFVEGKKRLGFLYSDFEKQTVSPSLIQDIIINSVAHCIETDLEIPTFEAFATLNVMQIQAINGTVGASSMRPLGFHLHKPLNKTE
jgi:hypothetical protein